ncbi:GNAT family N-acetyltransferase [Ruminococcus sp. CLA-AA-H200]|uniref:GNAT family N-acetyltransferase n=1 Tax=Ruminococcus turbiniformis TaxID=2881258 RepID=A0ABS8G1S9_9FIRM|nr:GNAT family N-acetyltransferase [Ruminococcus turbiniformis]MCC2256272.1 GNAT family N-acetyltransferase [Ruminococcus turbiniformis]
MEDCVVYEKVTSHKEIESVMINCSSDFFDQSINNPETIKSLALKFAEYGTFICARKEERIAGFVAFYANDKFKCCGFLSMIIISHQFRGGGIGSSLLRRCSEQCKKSGMTTLRLEVNEKNERAILFYKKNGFKEISKKDTSFFLEKNLLI